MGLVETHMCPFLPPPQAHPQPQRGPTHVWAHPCTQGPSSDPRKGTHGPVAVSLVLSCGVGATGRGWHPSVPHPPVALPHWEWKVLTDAELGSCQGKRPPLAPEQNAFVMAPGDTGTSPGAVGSRAGAGKAWPRGGHGSRHGGWARLVPAPRGDWSPPNPAEGEGRGPQPRSLGARQSQPPPASAVTPGCAGGTQNIGHHTESGGCHGIPEGEAPTHRAHPTPPGEWAN